MVLFLAQLAEPSLSESEPPRCGAEGVCGSNLSSLAAAARALSAIQPLAIGEPFGVPPEVRRLGGPLPSGGVCIPSPLTGSHQCLTAQTPRFERLSAEVLLQLIRIVHFGLSIRPRPGQGMCSGRC